MTTDERERYSGYAVLELFGHRVLAGYVEEVQIAGAGFIRIRVPGENGNWLAEQAYSPSAVYSLTPSTEATVRAMAARRGADSAVTRFELPPPPVRWPCQTEDCQGTLSVPESDGRVRCSWCYTFYRVERAESGVLFHRMGSEDAENYVRARLADDEDDAGETPF